MSASGRETIIRELPNGYWQASITLRSPFSEDKPYRQTESSFHDADEAWTWSKAMLALWEDAK